jgi:raffinose/stachyose/melibiose transport system permease protein
MKRKAKGIWVKKASSITAKTALVYTVFTLYMVPFALVLVNALKQKVNIVKHPLALVDTKGPQWHNFMVAIEKMNFPLAFCNSFVITMTSVAVMLVLSAMAAYLFVRTKWKICKFSLSLMLCSLVIPFQVIMIPLVSIYGGSLGLLNSRLTLIIMNIGFAVSICTFMCHGFIKSNIPLALEEAAQIDGCRPHGTFFRIVLPLMKPILSTIAILEILGLWNDYLLPSLILGRKELYTLPLVIRTFYGTFTNEYGHIMAGLILSMAPVIAVYAGLQRYIVGGVTAGAVKS